MGKKSKIVKFDGNKESSVDDFLDADSMSAMIDRLLSKNGGKPKNDDNEDEELVSDFLLDIASHLNRVEENSSKEKETNSDHQSANVDEPKIENQNDYPYVDWKYDASTANEYPHEEMLKKQEESDNIIDIDINCEILRFYFDDLFWNRSCVSFSGIDLCNKNEKIESDKINDSASNIFRMMIYHLLVHSTPAAIFTFTEFNNEFDSVDSYNDNKYIFIKLPDLKLVFGYKMYDIINTKIKRIYNTLTDKYGVLNTIEISLKIMSEITKQSFVDNMTTEDIELTREFLNDNYCMDNFKNDFMTDPNTKISYKSENPIDELVYTDFDSFDNIIRNILESIVGVHESFEDNEDRGALNDDEPFPDDNSEEEPQETEQEEIKKEEIKDEKEEDREEVEEIGFNEDQQSIEEEEKEVDEIDPDEFTFSDDDIDDESMIVDVVKG